MLKAIIAIQPDSLRRDIFGMLNPGDEALMGKIMETLRAGRYRMTGHIACEATDPPHAAEEMFELTNNPFRQAERLEKYGNGPSLSVGDAVIVVGVAAFICCSTGWVKVSI